jgi:NADH-quinone oxidoreductase subunit M
MTGLGAYAILRIIILTLNVELHPFIAIIALMSMLYGGVMALSQSNIKRLFAYSTVSQMGYILLGLASGLSGVVGGALHIVSHGLAKAGLFLAAGAIIYMTGKGEMEKVGGLIRRHPWLSLGILIPVLGLVGLPPMLPYVSEVFIFEPLLTADLYLAALAIIAGVITIVYFAIFIDKVVFGKPKKLKNKAEREITWPIYLLAALLILLGLIPDIVLRLITIMG